MSEQYQLGPGPYWVTLRRVRGFWWRARCRTCHVQRGPGRDVVAGGFSRSRVLMRACWHAHEVHHG